jgi:hypothetical protein
VGGSGGAGSRAPDPPRRASNRPRRRLKGSQTRARAWAPGPHWGASALYRDRDGRRGPRAAGPATGAGARPGGAPTRTPPAAAAPRPAGSLYSAGTEASLRCFGPHIPGRSSGQYSRWRSCSFATEKGVGPLFVEADRPAVERFRPLRATLDALLRSAEGQRILSLTVATIRCPPGHESLARGRGSLARVLRVEPQTSPRPSGTRPGLPERAWPFLSATGLGIREPQQPPGRRCHGERLPGADSGRAPPASGHRPHSRNGGAGPSFYSLGGLTAIGVRTTAS